LLLRLPGVLLLRLAERQFLELLFHEPPRSTRRWRHPFSASGKSQRAENLLAQLPRIAVSQMRIPTVAPPPTGC
jgi:hypothetical protein